MLPTDQLKQINVTVDGTSFALCCPRAHNIEYVTKEIFVDKQYPVFPFLQVQRFLSVHGITQNLFRVGRHLLRAADYRTLRARAFVVWNAVTCA
jgi:hypothetical protein